MAKFVLHNVRLFASGADYTARSNRVELGIEAESKDATSFAPTGTVWHEELPGIKSSTITAAGQWEAGDASMVDDSSFATLGGTGPVTIAPATAADGALAYMTAYARQAYQLGGAVGDVVPWTGTWNGVWSVARGVILHTPTVRTATGTGSVFQLPAVAAGQFLVGTLHVMSVAGTTPSITATVQSAALVGFGSPATRLTFAAQTAIGGQVFRLAGPITDTFYRISYTISGTTPSLLFMSAAGVSAS
jgi:hypothetical protein